MDYNIGKCEYMITYDTWVSRSYSGRFLINKYPVQLQMDLD